MPSLIGMYYCNTMLHKLTVAQKSVDYCAQQMPRGMAQHNNRRFNSNTA